MSGICLGKGSNFRGPKPKLTGRDSPGANIELGSFVRMQEFFARLVSVVGCFSSRHFFSWESAHKREREREEERIER